ncbi:hypothetical protein [Senimuribacter intestinalis]|nr:hypothetical protein [Senimuribacter intestinalis]
MIGFYLLRGHTLNELLSLSTVEKAVFMAAMAQHNEERQQLTKALQVVN